MPRYLLGMKQQMNDRVDASVHAVGHASNIRIDGHAHDSFSILDLGRYGGRIAACLYHVESTLVFRLDAKRLLRWNL